MQAIQRLMFDQRVWSAVVLPVARLPNADPMLFQCCASGVDAATALNQHWA